MAKNLNELRDGFYVWVFVDLFRVPEGVYKVARLVGCTVAKVSTRSFNSEEELFDYAVELESEDLDAGVAQLEAWEFQERTRRNRGEG